MSKSIFILPILHIFFLPAIALADVAMPLATGTVVGFVLILPIEIGVFYVYLWIKYRDLKYVKSEILKKRSIILIVILANIVTSLLGTSFTIYRYLINNLITVGLGFVLSLIIEWGVYVLYFIKTGIRVRDSFFITCVGNVLTYLVICLPVALAGVEGPSDFDRRARGEARNVHTLVTSYFTDYPDDTVDMEKLVEYGYWGNEYVERKIYGIKIKMKQRMRVKVSGHRSNFKIVTWHEKGRKIFTMDAEGKIHEELKSRENLN